MFVIYASEIWVVTRILHYTGTHMISNGPSNARHVNYRLLPLVS